MATEPDLKSGEPEMALGVQLSLPPPLYNQRRLAARKLADREEGGVMLTNLASLQMAIQFAWGEDTAKGDWKRDVPSLNQCAVTALVVQEFLGGELLRCEMSDGDSHYWNKIGTIEVDLTASQFQHTEGGPLRHTAKVRDREYVLSFPDTMKRYTILLERTKNILYVENVVEVLSHLRR